MSVQKASRDVVDLVTRPITQGIDVDGDGSTNFRIDGTGIGLSSPADAAFTLITMSGHIDMGGQRINNVSTPMAGTDAVNRDYVNTEDASTLVAANAYTDSQVGGIPPSADPTPAGAVMAYAGSVFPTGWLKCDGTSYSTATYPDLFAAIGYTYGGGGGSFNVPDMRGRTVAAPDDGAGLLTVFSAVLGAVAGSEEQGPHTHTYSGSTGAPSAQDSEGSGPFNGPADAHTHSFSGTTSDDSGNRGKIQPTMILNWMIKT